VTVQQTTLKIHTNSPAETQALATALGRRLQIGDFIALCGPLGAGKTCFVQGLGTGLEVAGRITSPTFIIMRHHSGPVPLCHADAYRISTTQELEEAGLTEMAEQSVLALEWAEKVSEIWPDELWIVSIEYDKSGRSIELIGRGRRPAAIIGELKDAYSGD